MKQDNIPVMILDKAGRLELDEEIAKLEQSLAKLRNIRKNTTSDDEWSSSDFNNIFGEEKLILSEMRRLRNILEHVVVVDAKEDGKHNVVELNDVVELNLAFEEDDKELMIVRLGTVRKNNPEDGIPVISVESPLGKAIYKQVVGKTVGYAVNNVSCTAEILSKVNGTVKEAEGSKTR